MQVELLTLGTLTSPIRLRGLGRLGSRLRNPWQHNPMQDSSHHSLIPKHMVKVQYLWRLVIWLSVIPKFSGLSANDAPIIMLLMPEKFRSPSGTSSSSSTSKVAIKPSEIGISAILEPTLYYNTGFPSRKRTSCNGCCCISEYPTGLLLHRLQLLAPVTSVAPDLKRVKVGEAEEVLFATALYSKKFFMPLPQQEEQAEECLNIISDDEAPCPETNWK